MYQRIYVPVDNSEHSDRAIDRGLDLARVFGSKLTGSHVYAASMHDYRFRQMEYTLPEEYLDEVELERQRKIHDSLITMGLKLISDSYLDPMARKCKEAGLEFEPRMMDGKHHVEILRDIAASDYDLVVIGALGVGRVRDSVLGSVCERVTRQCDRDVWVVKRVEAGGAPEGGQAAERDTILVGIDGSPQSFGALMSAIDLGKAFGKKVEAISIYDPYLHYKVFNGIVNVLTEQAAKVFRFEEQNQLHEEIIDTGLAQIYQSHLDVAARMAAEQGVEMKKTLLDGKAYQKILDHTRKTHPWLLVLGRIGVHSGPEETSLGSNTENLLRLTDCDVLITRRAVVPSLDVKAEESIRWTPEAESRMTRVPAQVRGVARTGILRLALEKGHSVITNAVIDEAMDRFMPKQTKDATQALAEAVALERARSRPVSMCRRCGVTALESAPAVCTVCGAADFETVTPEMIEKIARVEGGLTEETTYDGRKLRWSEEAKKALWSMRDAYQRRRTKARVEKGARMRRLDIVTLEFAKQIIEEETGRPLVVPAVLPPEAARAEAGAETATGAGMSGAQAGPPAAGPGPELRLVARDGNKNPLLSPFAWTPEGIERVFRVPAGFMRNQTQERIEAVAREKGASTIDLALVEEGIEFGKKMMAEMIAGYQKPAPAAVANPAPAAAARPAGAENPAPPPARPGGSYLNEVGPAPTPRQAGPAQRS
ncbi:MAG TPA: universal stress protein [Patescibacteria group bacterium]|nr:universal stress protein [Patescibacteria group bacterium]